MRIFYLIIILIFNQKTIAQNAHKLLRKGDNEYVRRNYKNAEELYRKADITEGSGKTKFNLGNATYNQQKYDEAIKQYDHAAYATKDNQLKSSSLYNKGNSYFWKQDYAKAIESYKDALRLNPRDEEAKKNLAFAKKMQQQQQQQQKNEEDKKNNQDKKDKNNQDNKNDKKQEQDKQNKDNQDPNQNPQQNNQQQPQQNINKEEAKRMLQIMDDEERKVQQRLRKGKPMPSRSTKDW